KDESPTEGDLPLRIPCRGSAAERAVREVLRGRRTRLSMAVPKQHRKAFVVRHPSRFSPRLIRHNKTIKVSVGDSYLVRGSYRCASACWLGRRHWDCHRKIRHESHAASDA